MTTLRYKRILLKLSGEALQDSAEYRNIDATMLQSIAHEIHSIYKLGVEIGIVIGAGNIFRGMDLRTIGIQQVRADQMGMLATVINALALQNALENLAIPCQVQSALAVEHLVEPFCHQSACQYLAQGKIVIFAGGTGNPFFTTDTAAALRGAEINADILVKATKVDGVYDDDPLRNTDATRYTSLSLSSAIAQQLKVMDATALILCQERKLPILVVSMFTTGVLQQAVLGKQIGTLLTTQ